MDIRITDFVAGAREAIGLVVVIDVFRAFSLAAHAFARGATRIHPVSAIEDAFGLRETHPGALLVGERHARPLPGVDCGNSPAQLEAFDLRGRTLIHTTHSGTQGLCNAVLADQVITGALVNAAAIVGYIQRQRPSAVTLVRMGHEARERCAEDDACATIIAARLRGERLDETGLVASLRDAPSARKFFEPACDWAPERDFELCTQVDCYDFVLRLMPGAMPAVLERVDVPRS